MFSITEQNLSEIRHVTENRFLLVQKCVLSLHIKPCVQSCNVPVITHNIPVRPGRRWSTEPVWPYCQPSPWACPTHLGTPAKKNI